MVAVTFFIIALAFAGCIYFNILGFGNLFGRFWRWLTGNPRSKSPVIDEDARPEKTLVERVARTNIDKIKDPTKQHITARIDSLKKMLITVLKRDKRFDLANKLEELEDYSPYGCFKLNAEIYKIYTEYSAVASAQKIHFFEMAYHHALYCGYASRTLAGIEFADQIFVDPKENELLVAPEVVRRRYEMFEIDPQLRAKHFDEALSASQTDDLLLPLSQVAESLVNYGMAPINMAAQSTLKGIQEPQFKELQDAFARLDKKDTNFNFPAKSGSNEEQDLRWYSALSLSGVDRETGLKYFAQKIGLDSNYNFHRSFANFINKMQSIPREQFNRFACEALFSHIQTFAYIHSEMTGFDHKEFAEFAKVARTWLDKTDNLPGNLAQHLAAGNVDLNNRDITPTARLTHLYQYAHSQTWRLSDKPKNGAELGSLLVEQEPVEQRSSKKNFHLINELGRGLDQLARILSFSGIDELMVHGNRLRQHPDLLKQIENRAEKMIKQGQLAHNHEYCRKREDQHLGNVINNLFNDVVRRTNRPNFAEYHNLYAAEPVAALEAYRPEEGKEYDQKFQQEGDALFADLGFNSMQEACEFFNWHQSRLKVLSGKPEILKRAIRHVNRECAALNMLLAAHEDSEMHSDFGVGNELRTLYLYPLKSLSTHLQWSYAFHDVIGTALRCAGVPEDMVNQDESEQQQSGNWLQQRIDGDVTDTVISRTVKEYWEGINAGPRWQFERSAAEAAEVGKQIQHKLKVEIMRSKAKIMRASRDQLSPGPLSTLPNPEKVIEKLFAVVNQARFLIDESFANDPRADEMKKHLHEILGIFNISDLIEALRIRKLFSDPQYRIDHPTLVDRTYKHLLAASPVLEDDRSLQNMARQIKMHANAMHAIDLKSAQPLDCIRQILVRDFMSLAKFIEEAKPNSGWLPSMFTSSSPTAPIIRANSTRPSTSASTTSSPRIA